MGRGSGSPDCSGFSLFGFEGCQRRFCSGLFTETPRAREFQVERQLVLQ